MEESKDWDGITLRELVYEIFDKKATDSKEFQSYVRIFGREKMKQFWIDWNAERGIKV